MRCSSCSDKIDPVVAIDIDGTLGPFHEHFLEFAERYLGIEPVHYGTDRLKVWNDYDGSVGFRDWFCEEYDTTTAQWKDIKLAYRQGGMKRTMPAYRHGVELTRYVTGQGAELWLTTSRPAYRLDNIDPDTQEWCRRNGVAYDYMLYDDDKYERLAERVDPARVVAVLDDLPEMYDAALVRFGPDVPILAKSPWNRGVSRQWEVPVDTLQDSARLIGQRIYKWKQDHNDS